MIRSHSSFLRRHGIAENSSEPPKHSDEIDLIASVTSSIVLFLSTNVFAYGYAMKLLDT